MPGIATHYIFGVEVHRELQGLIGANDHEREAFLLGNFGPDPFLFLRVAPIATRYRTLGSRMHGKKPTELLAAVHSHLIADSRGTQVTRAYALGFMCHYLLDSTVHQLVYAQQQAISAEGIGFGGLRASRAVHAAIETCGDEHFLSCKLGATAVTFPPHREMFGCPAPVMAEISEGLAGALDQAYGINAPAGLFVAAVGVNRLAQVALDSKCGGLRRYVDYLAPLGVLTPNVRMMSYTGAPVNGMTLMNYDHAPWPHPFDKGRVVSESYDELYDAAFARALDVLPAFGGAEFGLESCWEVTRGRNFASCRVDSESILQKAAS